MDWIEKAFQKEDSKSEILSFQDYIAIFEKKPLQELRPSFQYLLDMLEYFGVEKQSSKQDQSAENEIKKLHLFELNHSDSSQIFGQEQTQSMIFKNLTNFKEEGYNNKLLVLVGPNGSAKSSIVRKIMKGAEEYSLKDEGALYTFSWIFPIDQFVKGSLGLNNNVTKSDLESFAYLEDREITAVLSSELKDHPLLLIPLEHRQEYLESILSPADLNQVKKTYLFKGEVSKRNKMIYDALLKNYKGNHLKVLKHIRVERFYISKRYSNAAVSIEPQMHVDARLQQITMDKRLGSLPPSLQSLNLFSISGEVILANRGILEFSDILKRPLDTFKYLLMTTETSEINLSGILTELDIFFMATTNELHLNAFKQHPDYNSFKGRFNFVRVPYLLKYRDEMAIYEEQIKRLEESCWFEPETLKLLCQFSVMTRLRAPIAKSYQNDQLAKIVSSLSPLEKAEFYNSKMLPKSLDSEAKQLLLNSFQSVFGEFQRDNLYEGKFGLSPRDIKNIIYDMSNQYESISFIELFDHLGQLVLDKENYEFLNIPAQGDYHHAPRFLDLLKDQAWNDFDYKLRNCLGLVDDRSYEEYIQKYISNVTALMKGEKIKNQVTGKYENIDDYFIKEFEKNINLSEDSNHFRSHLISKLGAYALDHPNEKLVYTTVFPELVYELKESFRTEQKKSIQQIARNIIFYEDEVMDDKEEQGKKNLSSEDRKQIDLVLKKLHENYGYSQKGAFILMKKIIKDRYE